MKTEISNQSIDAILEALDESKKTIAEQDKQIDNFITKSLEDSIKLDEKQRLIMMRADQLYRFETFVCEWLSVFERKFMIEKSCPNIQAAKMYVQQAIYMRDNFGRKGHHYISEVQAWLNSDNLPFK